MQARRLPALRGVFWLFEGFRLFRRNPPLITALTLVYLLAVQLFALLPLIGPVLLPILLPLLTLIVANGCRLVDLRQNPDKRTLLFGLSGAGNNFPALLRLGGLQLAGALLVVLIAIPLGGGEDPFASALMAGPDGAAGVDPTAQAALLAKLAQVLLLATPLIIAFWFAPFLVGWDRVAPVKSLFFSAVASMRNWRAMAMFSLAAIAIAGLLPALVLILLGQISGSALSVAFIVLRMLLVFLVAPVLTASIYVSYRDIFQAET